MFSNYEEVCNLENKENNATEMFAIISLIFSELLRILLHIFVGANIMKILVYFAQVDGVRIFHSVLKRQKKERKEKHPSDSGLLGCFNRASIVFGAVSSL